MSHGHLQFFQLEQKAYIEGREAWARGDVANPYHSAEMHAAWSNGWNDAQADGLAGRIFSVPDEDGIYTGIPDTVYHADPHSLSSSGARALLQPGGPAKFRHAPRVEKREYDFGHVAHALILGEGSTIMIVDADDWRTKAAKEARDIARADGKVAVLRKTFQQGESLAQAAKDHELGELLFAQGRPEQSAYWHDEQSGARLRCRPDWLTLGERPIQVDVKTTKSAAPTDFVNSIRDYGYHQQHAFYVDGLAAHGQATEFLFFAVEVTKPYLAAVIELPEEAVTLGRNLNRAAIDLYARCMEHDVWPGYAPIIHRVDLQPWAYTDADTIIRTAERTLT